MAAKNSLTIPSHRPCSNTGALDRSARSPAQSSTTTQPTTPVLHRFETEQEATELNVARCNRLEKRLPKIAKAIDGCSRHNRCALPVCAVCALEYRRPVVKRIISLLQSRGGARQTVTIYLDTIEAGELANTDLKKTRETLKKRVDRAGFKGAVLVGGIEVSWNAKEKHWLLHVHLFAAGASEDMWKKLREVYRGVKKAVVLKRLNDRNLEKQISYLVKFVTYHRPGERGVAKARSYPLPRDRLAEWASWSARFKFKDFLFVYGARRRGQVIVPVVG
jgi:hypothetical protein